MPSALFELCKAWSGEPPRQIAPITHQSASHRLYFRIESARGSVIGAYYDNVRENEVFLYFSKHFAAKDLPVPAILAESPDRTAYLQEDLGPRSLFSELEANAFAYTPAIRDHYLRTVEALAALQIRGHEGLDYSRGLSTAGFGKQEMIWDLSYFKYYFLKRLDIPFDEYALENDFQTLAGWLDTAAHRYFMHRDFQSRNILLPEGKPHFIDYQGGRKGPLQYDLVSLLWQARANLPMDAREALLEHYLLSVSKFIPVDQKAFSRHYYGFVLLRTLQVLGAYGLRGLVEKKAHFLESIPFALDNLGWLLENREWPIALPELRKTLDHLVAKKKHFKRPLKAGPDHPLHILIQSFSYKKGIPADESGHGGGFVFDCRGIDNPGRQEQYRPLTGRSPEVIAYLREHSNMDAWLANVFATLSETVENYIERDLDSLSISFGCTGGQHRSVYAADQTAAYLQRKYGVKISLRHTEEANWPR